MMFRSLAFALISVIFATSAVADELSSNPGIYTANGHTVTVNGDGTITDKNDLTGETATYEYGDDGRYHGVDPCTYVLRFVAQKDGSYKGFLLTPLYKDEVLVGYTEVPIPTLQPIAG